MWTHVDSMDSTQYLYSCLAAFYMESIWSPGIPDAGDHVTWPLGLCASPQVYKEGHLAQIPQLSPPPLGCDKIRLD